jgi:hypothetical protein
MTLADILIDAQESAGPDSRRMCWYLAGVIQGLQEAAQDQVSSGYVRCIAKNEKSLKESPEAIIELFEHVSEIDD